MSGKQLENCKCKVCGEQAVGFEPRFNYFYCKEHSNTPPAKVYEESLKYARKSA